MTLGSHDVARGVSRDTGEEIYYLISSLAVQHMLWSSASWGIWGEGLSFSQSVTDGCVVLQFTAHAQFIAHVIPHDLHNTQTGLQFVPGDMTPDVTHFSCISVFTARQRGAAHILASGWVEDGIGLPLPWLNLSPSLTYSCVWHGQFTSSLGAPVSLSPK